MTTVKLLTRKRVVNEAELAKNNRISHMYKLKRRKKQQLTKQQQRQQLHRYNQRQQKLRLKLKMGKNNKSLAKRAEEIRTKEKKMRLYISATHVTQYSHHATKSCSMLIRRVMHYMCDIIIFNIISIQTIIKCINLFKNVITSFNLSIKMFVQLS